MRPIIVKSKTIFFTINSTKRTAFTDFNLIYQIILLILNIKPTRAELIRSFLMFAIMNKSDQKCSVFIPPLIFTKNFYKNISKIFTKLHLLTYYKIVHFYNFYNFSNAISICNKNTWCK